MAKPNLNIAISADCNYLPHAATSACSVALNNHSDFNEIHLYLLANDIPQETLEQFSNHLKGLKLHVHIYNISDIRSRLGINIPKTISLSAYSRLFLQSIMPEEIDKVIYMDVDSVNVDSYKELYNIDIKEYSVAGVLDDVSLSAKSNIGLPFDAPYINSGFLLINLEYWRKHDMQGQFLRFLKEHNGNVFHHDQGIINAVCNDSKYILHPKYNVVSNFFSKKIKEFTVTPFYSADEIEEAKRNPVFIHFTPGVVNRPWLRNCRHPLKHEYLKYRAMTPYAKQELPYDNRPFRLRLLSFLYFRCRPLYNLTLKLRSSVSNKI